MRLLIVDDHPLMRMGITQLVRQEWPDAQIDEAPTIAEALQRIAAARPDLVTLDLSLPDSQGTEGANRLLRVLTGVPLLVLSLNAEAAYAARLLQMGVSGYLPKDRAPEELRVALRRLSDGGRYVTSAMADHLLGLLSGKAPDALPHEQLSAQEHRVMLLIAAGHVSPNDAHPPAWVIISCYAAISFGTLFGGWRIVKTMGQKITKLKPVGGFCAETGGAITLFLATALGVPVSTTHTITGAIVGVGSVQRPSAVRWGVAGSIVWAWIFTIPAAALMAGICYWISFVLY